MANVLKKILGDPNEKALKKLRPLVAKINNRFEQYSGLKIEELREFQTELLSALAMGKGWDEGNVIVDRMNKLSQERGAISDDELKGKTLEFKSRIKKKVGKATGKEKENLEQEALNEIIPEAYAVVKETCRRLVGKNWSVSGHEWTWKDIPFDTQLMGGIVLHQGKIAEMATGEGKTLAATMPLYLNSLLGRGCHLITVNDYLSSRDSQWMGGIYEFLGVSVGCVQNATTPHSEERKEQYKCDITYGTNQEFGFDYLRDNMTWNKDDKVHGPYYYAIVDEIDSVLVDEARTPLIISGAVERTINREYARYKPVVEGVFSQQTALVNRLLSDAEKMLRESDKALEEGKDKEGEGKRTEAGKLLVQVQKGAPKNRKLMKLKKEQGVMKLVEDVGKELLAAELAQKTSMRKEESELHKLQEKLFYTIDEKSNVVSITELGRETIAPKDVDFFLLPDLSQELPKVDEDQSLSPREKLVAKQAVERDYAEKSEKLHTLNQLFKAYELFKKDEQYVVQDKNVVIVDEFTGRLMPGRRYSDGLHQALQAKEGVQVESETQTLATVTLQNYFRMYQKLAGMTGTAETEAREFWDIYKLDVVVMPTNRPVRRIEHEDVIYKTRGEKYDAIMSEIGRMHDKGRPVLVGTVSVDVSETLSRMLKRKGIQHEVLNAKHHQKEAEVVALAGQPGRVTIATNMAGRGTDIKLGEGVVKCEYCCIGCSNDCSKCPKEKKMTECLSDSPCGLHIIGTERHEARRIDRQLRGRCARQGDPGSARFYLSLEDSLMRLFGSDRIAGVMARWGPADGEPIEHKLVTRAIEGAQKRVEMFHFDIRKHLLEYDDVINKQRETIYSMRDEILEGADLSDRIKEMTGGVIDNIADVHAAGDYAETWDWSAMSSEVREVFLSDFTVPDEEKAEMNKDGLIQRLESTAFSFYKTREEQVGSEMMRNLEHQVLLHVLDRNWKDHLYEIDALKEGIGLRGYGQRDPLVEFKREAYVLFEGLLINIDREVVRNLYGLRFRSEEERRREANVPAARAYKPDVSTPEPVIARAPDPGMGQQSASPLERPYQMPVERPRQETYQRSSEKVRRNDPCPCGSGKKYKACCGKLG
jgi:preprotein translocase subunit SecA